MMTADPRAAPPRLTLSHIPSRDCLKSFRCGVRDIDTWATRKAFKLHDSGRAKVTVAYSEGSKAPCGFYCLTLSIEAANKLLRQEDRDAWKDNAPLVYLDWIAVSSAMQRRGIGGGLLVHALSKAVAVNEVIPIYGVGLRSLNDNTTKLYERFQFRRAPKEDGSHPLMILPIWTAIDLFGRPPAAQTSP